MTFQVHTPPSRKSIEKRREKVFEQLLDQIIEKAEREKAKLNGVENRMALERSEIRELAEKTRAHLEKIGWFKEGAGIR